MLGLSWPSSAQVHTLILLRVSEERMVLASSCQHLNSVSWFSAHSSSSVSITVMDSLNSTISGNSLHRKQDKKTWMLAGAEPKFWKFWHLPHSSKYETFCIHGRQMDRKGQNKPLPLSLILEFSFFRSISLYVLPLLWVQNGEFSS